MSGDVWGCQNRGGIRLALSGQRPGMLMRPAQHEDSCPHDGASRGPVSAVLRLGHLAPPPYHTPTHPPLLVRSAPPLPSQASGPCPLLFTLFCFQWKSHFTPKLRQNTDGLFQHLLAQSYRNIGTALRGPSIPCFNLAFSCHIRPIVPAPSKGKANCKHLHPEMHSQSLIFSPS